MKIDPEDYATFHPVAKEVIDRLRANPHRSPDSSVLLDLMWFHGRCGTGSGLCDDGGHAWEDGCLVTVRIGSHLGITR
jgi:hypothetical protein